YEKAMITLSAELRSRISNMFSKEESAIIGQEASEVKLRMVGGRRIMYMQLGFIVHGHSRREVERNLLSVNSVFKKMSVVPDIERSMCLQAISYSWPLVFRN